VTENLVTPSVEEIQIPEEPEPKPRKIRKRFVNRNGTWLRTKRLKRFHPGEKVYVKSKTGKFRSHRPSQQERQASSLLCRGATMSDVATVNLIELFKYNKQELGVLLALLTHSGKVPQILAELEAEGGSLGAAVLESYAKADAELQAVAATKLEKSKR
jgi:hypothetical protein